jgi:hypothetical protein
MPIGEYHGLYAHHFANDALDRKATGVDFRGDAIDDHALSALWR